MWTNPHRAFGKEPAGEQTFLPQAEIDQGMGDPRLDDTEDAEQGDPADDRTHVAVAVQLTEEFCRPKVSSVIPVAPGSGRSSRTCRWR